MRLVTRLLCRNGNTALYFALALLPIVVLIGGGIDFQRSNNAKQQLQYVLDASVLAAARAGVEDYPTSAPLYFEGAASDITNFDPSASFSHRMQGADTVFTGTANATVPGLFTQMFGRDGISVAVESEAIRPGDASQPCIILLDQRENFALRVNSGADIQAETCEVHVHSTANWAANFNAGITLVFDRICIAGANVLDNDGTTENIELECTADPDPYSGRFPAPDTSSCDHTGLNMNGGSITLSPGVYCNGINFNGTVNVDFEPGVYVVKSGDWNVNGGDWSGEGVTFFFADQSRIQFNSGVQAFLRPPETGDYANLMIFEAEGLPESSFILNDSRDFDIEGIIHLPSRNTTYNAGSQVYSRKLTMVFNTLLLNNTRWLLEPAEGSGTGSVNTDLRLSH